MIVRIKQNLQKSIIKKSIKGFVLIALLFSFVFFADAYAATGIPSILHHQGRLLDASGNLLGGSSGTNYCLRFSIWDLSTGGTANPNQLWPSAFATPSTMTINVKNGILNADIGDTTAGGDLLNFDFNSTDEVYLNIQVANSVAGSCAGVSSFETLNPRQRIVSSGYSINSRTVSGYTPSQNPTGNDIPVLTNGSLNLLGSIASGGLTLTLGSDATGDIFFRSSSGAFDRLGIGIDGSALVVSGGLPSWQILSYGDAFVGDSLAQFADTSSVELKSVITDETGNGPLVFADSPDFDGTVTGINAAMVGAPAGSGTFSGTSSGTNTGDNAVNTLYSGLASSKQDAATNLSSLSTLSYGAVSFVKMTAAGTFALDTTVLGSLATQSGTFSGTSSGTNTGDDAVNTLYSGLENSKQDAAANLDSLSNLAYGSVSFVKMTAAGTFGLDTTVLGSLATQSGTFSGTSSGTNSGDDAPNSSSTYIGTTAVALNRSSGPLTLGGITLTTPDLGTPAAVVLTNASGTASNLTSGLATSIVGGAGGSIPYQSAAGTTAMLANGNAGQFLKSNGTTLAPSWGDAEVPLTFSNGLTRTVNAISNNLITGLVGGQTVIGGTAITDALSFKGTTGDGTLTSAAMNFLVGNNGATVAGLIRNDAKWILGTTAPTNLGLVNINAATSTIPALTVNMTPSASADIAQFWRANAQKVVYIDQYGGLNLGQTNSTGQMSVNSNGNFTQVVSFVNTNVGVGAGSLLTIGTSGSGQALFRTAGGGVNFTQGVNVPQKSNGALWGIATDNSPGNNNTFMSAHTQGGGNALETSEYVRPNVHFGQGLVTSADNLLVAGGNMQIFNANTFGGGVGSEVLSNTTFTGGTSWARTADMAYNTDKYTYTHSTGTGTLSQTSANFATPVAPNTYYKITFTVSSVTGSPFFQIGDPNGTFSIPISIQHPQTAGVKFGGTSYGTLANGTHTYWFKTAPTAASLTNIPFVMTFKSTAAATVTITAISLKPAQGGDLVLGGLIRAPGSNNSSNGLKVNAAGKVKLNAAETDTPLSWLDVPASTSTVASLNITPGVAKSTPIAGDIYAVTDDLFYTITTGAAAKGIVMDNGTRLTAGKIPIATTNGRLIDAVGTLPQAGSYSNAATAATTFTVTIGTTMANANYQVNVTPTASVSAAPFYITNKTTTTFDVEYLAGLTGTVTFDWSVFP